MASLAETMGAPVAVLMQVPEQPLFGGKKEDEIISYTFDGIHEERRRRMAAALADGEERRPRQWMPCRSSPKPSGNSTCKISW